MEIIEIIAQESGERIDALLARSEDSLTRSAAQKLLDAGKVCVNGKAVRKNYKCQSGDTVRFSLPEPEETELVAQDIPLVKLFLCQLTLLCKAGQLVYSLNLCVFHQSMLPNSSSVFSNAGIKCSIKYSTSGML